MAIDVLVLGAGIMGCATAYWLAKQGKRVVVLDQHQIGHAAASSADEARVIRYEYGGRALYTKMVAESVELWKSFERETDRTFYQEIGTLALQSIPNHQPLIDGFNSLVELGYEPQWLEQSEIRKRFPEFTNIDSGVITEGIGGYISAKTVLHALAGRALQMGAIFESGVQATDLIEAGHQVVGVRTSNGKTYNAGAVVVAAGPWTRQLLPDLKIPVVPNAAYMHYLIPTAAWNFSHPQFLPFIIVDKLYYGRPIHGDGALKVGDHSPGPELGPDQPSTPMEPTAYTRLQEFLGMHLPALSNATLVKQKICRYSMTPDADFILDTLPQKSNAFIAAGFSGHGFKFGILIGKIMSDLAIYGETTHDIRSFQLGRTPLRVDDPP